MTVCRAIAIATLLVISQASTICAQLLPWDIAVDADFRLEFLFGRQTLGKESVSSDLGYFDTSYNPLHPDPLERFNIQYGPRIPVLEGVVELSASQSLSARLSGSTSVLESTGGYTLVSGPSWSSVSLQPFYPVTLYYSSELSTIIKPTFWFWEAAGLYHIFHGSGYRYSAVAGYRQELWRYVMTSGQDDSSFMRDEFVSQAPFIGLQTAMFFPWWKARAEVLGSPFMTKKISHTAQDQGYYQQVNGNWRNGGFLEFQVEGTVSVMRPGCWFGVFARYTYEELRGEVKGTRAAPGTANYETFPYDFYTLKTMGTIGFDFSVVF